MQFERKRQINRVFRKIVQKVYNRDKASPKTKLERLKKSME